MIEHIIKIGLLAGKAIMAVYEHASEVEIKENNSPLTLADKLSHNVISDGLAEIGLPILSEEGKSIDFAERKNWSRFWMIDPLDGTKEFIKKNGEFTVNIALIDSNTPIMGVVYAPAKGLLYWGEMGKGAFRVSDIQENESLGSLLNRKTALKPNPTAKPFKIVASRSHNSPETDEFIESIKSEKGEIELVSIGSSLKLCYVADGTAQIYPRFAPTMEWDTAAAHAVAKSAGCNVVDATEKQELVYNKENLLNPWFIVNC
jgi:3'(2'), 5'-bisphosphate nucleotidase